MLLDNLKQQKHFKLLGEKITSVTEKILQIFDRLLAGPRNIVTAWHKLHANQKIYVLAFGLLIAYADEIFSGKEDYITVVGCIALIAMARELLSLFTKIWDTMLGKSIVLVLYAIVANFTLSLSAQKINMIVGVAPSELIYTQGLTTLMMLPFWILLLSVLALTFVFVGSQFKSIFFGLLRLLRLHHIKPENKEHFSGIFLIIRLIILPLVIMTLAQGLTWYSQKIHIQNLSFDITDLLSKEQKINLEEEKHSAKKEIETELKVEFGTALVEKSIKSQNTERIISSSVKKSPKALEAELKADQIASISAKELEGKLEADKITSSTSTNEMELEEVKVFRFGGKVDADSSGLTLFDRAIASFVYHFEAFEFSRCKITKTERAVPLNENDILVVEKDNSDIGFKFSARLCELK